MEYAQWGIKIIAFGVIGFAVAFIQSLIDRDDLSKKTFNLALKVFLAGLVVYVYGNIIFILR